ncbi:MAG TPA: hypothetical protein VGM73_01815 [Candidatus Didemnitutus sp.]
MRVPVRTYGRLHRPPDGHAVLHCRPLLGDPEALRTLLLRPPRCLGYGDVFNRVYPFAGTRDIGLRWAWAWQRETVFGKRKSPREAVVG